MADDEHDHDQGSAADWQQAGKAGPAGSNERARDDQAAGQPRGEDAYAREMVGGDGDDPPTVTGDEPTPR